MTENFIIYSENSIVAILRYIRKCRFEKLYSYFAMVTNLNESVFIDFSQYFLFIIVSFKIFQGVVILLALEFCAVYKRLN